MVTPRRSPAGPIAVLILMFAGSSLSPSPRALPQPAVSATEGLISGTTEDAAAVPLGAPENVGASGSGEHNAGAAELPAATHGEASPATETGAPTSRRTARGIQATATLQRPTHSVAPRTGGCKVGCTRLRGIASYYGTGGPGQYAAMHDYIDGTAVQVVVCTFLDGTTRCLTVPVVTQCAACKWAAGATLVDLSIPAWLEISGGLPLSRGVLPVTVEVLS